MNREQKRLMQRVGAVDSEGEPVAPQAKAPKTLQNRPESEKKGNIFQRLSIFLSEVRAELRKVAWPNREEVTNYSTVVILTLVLIGGLVFGIDYGCTKAVAFLFKT